MSTEPELGSLLEEQRAYYQALARDYLSQGLELPGGGELAGALEGFRPAVSVLELACGPGVWTSALLRHATDVTAVDASAGMLAIAAARITSSRVRFIRRISSDTRSAARWQRPADRLASTTSEPAAASAVAIARPSPAEPPVTSAT